METQLACFLALALLNSAAVQSNTAGRVSESMEDVQNIDTISGPGVSDILSIEKELSIGNTVAADFEKSVRLIGDSASKDFVNRLGESVHVHSDAKIACQFSIVDSDEMDVLAFLGGHIYVTRALIHAAGNEAELAGAIAHGIAHVSARHTGRLLYIAKNAPIAAIPVFPWSWAGPATSMIPEGLGLGKIGVIQREFEVEADQLAVRYLWKSGYDPNAYVSLLQKLADGENTLSGTGARRLLSFMPATGDRIVASAKELSRLPSKENYRLNTSAFERFKANIVAIGSAQQSDDEDPAFIPGQKRPTIKRGSK